MIAMNAFDSSTTRIIFVTKFLVVDLPNVLQAFEQCTNGRAHIGVKKMGVLNNKVFANAYRNIQSQEDAQFKAATLCSKWETELRNPQWHPFMVVEDGDKYTVCRLYALCHSF
jgi:hypothetical protein